MGQPEWWEERGDPIQARALTHTWWWPAGPGAPWSPLVFLREQLGARALGPALGRPEITVPPGERAGGYLPVSEAGSPSSCPGAEGP